jgi:Mg-chelatase subunit ChlI
MTEIEKLFPDHNLINMGAFKCDPLMPEAMYLAVPKKQLTAEELEQKHKRIEKLFSYGLDKA